MRRYLLYSNSVQPSCPWMLHVDQEIVKEGNGRSTYFDQLSIIASIFVGGGEYLRPEPSPLAHSEQHKVEQTETQAVPAEESLSRRSSQDCVGDECILPLQRYNSRVSSRTTQEKTGRKRALEKWCFYVRRKEIFHTFQRGRRVSPYPDTASRIEPLVRHLNLPKLHSPMHIPCTHICFFSHHFFFISEVG